MNTRNRLKTTKHNITKWNATTNSDSETQCSFSAYRIDNIRSFGLVLACFRAWNITNTCAYTNRLYLCIINTEKESETLEYCVANTLKTHLKCHLSSKKILNIFDSQPKRKFDSTFISLNFQLLFFSSSLRFNSFWIFTFAIL